MKFGEPKGLLKYARIKKLYNSAFPKCERKPFWHITQMHRRGKTDIWYFEDEEGFLGFATTINGDEHILIDYFAVAENRRGKGNGSEMLKMLTEHYSPRGVFLEVEVPDPDAENYPERIRRKEFYIRAGFTPMNTRARLFGVDFELLGKECRLGFQDYRGFYLFNYGKRAFDNIQLI